MKAPRARWHCGVCHRFVRGATVRGLGFGHTGECPDHGHVEVYWGHA